MPPITALLHAKDEELRLGRALETLFPCAEILVVDHASVDATRRIARRYGARIVSAENDSLRSHYLDVARYEWIFCLAPTESISEGLQATLLEWSALPSEDIAEAAFSVPVRRQVGECWLEVLAPEIRLIPRHWARWRDGEEFPADDPSAVALVGELLRFEFP